MFWLWLYLHWCASSVVNCISPPALFFACSVTGCPAFTTTVPHWLPSIWVDCASFCYHVLSKTDVPFWFLIIICQDSASVNTLFLRNIISNLRRLCFFGYVVFTKTHLLSCVEWRTCIIIYLSICEDFAIWSASYFRRGFAILIASYFKRFAILIASYFTRRLAPPWLRCTWDVCSALIASRRPRLLAGLCFVECG